MNDSSEVIVSLDQSINLLRFNRPDKKNAITCAMYTTLTEGLLAGEQNADCRVHVWMGQPGTFTAGNDLKDFMASTAGGAGLGKEVVGFIKTLASVNKPMIAAVDGLAIGIGTTMLMHCDMVFASPASFFQTPFTHLGLVPEAASSLIAPNLFGPQRAFELLALGERWSSEKALSAGLVNAIIDSEDIEGHTLDVAKTLASKPPQSLLTTRQLIRGNRADILGRIDEEVVHFSHHLYSDEAQQAFAAFAKK